MNLLWSKTEWASTSLNFKKDSLKDYWQLKHLGILQDNDPKHTSKVVQNFLKTMDVEQVTKFSPNSPDVNPIENLCPLMQRESMQGTPET